MADAVMTFRGDDGDLIRKVAELERGMKRLDDRVKQFNRTGKEQTDIMGDIGRKTIEIAAGFGLWTTGQDVLRGLVDLAKEYYENLKLIGDELDKSRGGAAAFAALQPPGMAAGAVSEARMIFGELGISGSEQVGQAFRQTAELQSLLGSRERAFGAIRTADMAGDIGMEQDAVRQAMLTGISMGLSPEQSVGAAVLMQQATGKQADVLARSAATKGVFGLGPVDLLQGYAVAGSLRGSLSSREMKGVVDALGSTAGQESDAWSALGLDRASMMSRGVGPGDIDFRRLVEVAGMSGSRLEQAGFSREEREAFALLSGQGGRMQELMGIMTPGRLSGALGELNRSVLAVPELRIGEEIENVTGGMYARATTGIEAERAFQKEQRDRLRALELENQGVPITLEDRQKGVGVWRFMYKTALGTFTQTQGEQGATPEMLRLLTEIAESNKRIAKLNEDMARGVGSGVTSPRRSNAPSDVD